MIKKGKKRDYELNVLDAKFEIARLKWAEPEETKDVKKKVKEHRIK